MKQKILVLFLLLAILLPMTMAQAQDDPVTLTIWHQFTGPDEETWTAIKDAFAAEHPNITIDDTPYAAADLLQALTVALPAGEGPDLAYLDASAAYLGAVVEAEFAVDLSQHFAERGWDEVMFPFAQAVTSYDGNNYGVGGFAEILGIFYRADLFEELGLEVPVTWEAVITAADKALDEDMIPFNVGGLEAWPIGHFCGVLLHSMVPVDTIGALEMLDGDSLYRDEPEAIAALAECQLWVQEYGYYSDDVVGVSNFDALNEFVAGTGLMRIDGSFSLPYYADTEYDIQFVPFPMRDVEMPLQAEGGLSSTWVVLTEVGDDLDAALDLLDFVVFSEEANAIWAGSGLIPAVNFDMSQVDVMPLLTQTVEGMSQVESIGYWIAYMADPAYSDAMNNAFAALLLGEMTAEDMADEISVAMEEVRELRSE